MKVTLQSHLPHPSLYLSFHCEWNYEWFFAKYFKKVLHLGKQHIESIPSEDKGKVEYHYLQREPNPIICTLHDMG